MSVKCPSCGFDSPDGAAWCDFCKEPFAKKAKPAPQAAPAPAAPAPVPAPLAGVTKETVDKLPVADLLKPELEPPPEAPAWLRPLAWLMLTVVIVTGTLSLFLLRRHYETLAVPAPNAPAPGAAAAPRLP